MTISKIQAGSINLSDDFAFTGTVTGAGKIIQVKHASFGSTISTTSGTQAATGIAMDFTPLFATSKLLVTFILHGVYNSTANSGWNLYVYRDGSGVTEGGLHTGSGHEGRFVYAVAHTTGGEILEVSCQVFLSANSTSQTNIALWGGRYNSGTNYINVNAASGDVSFMSIMEIAQ